MQNDYDPFDLDAQQEKANARKLDEKLMSQQEVEDFLWVMRDARGRRFMWRLLSMTHIFKTSFTGNSETFFREGERNIGCRYMDEIHTHCHELYGSMVREQKDKDKQK